MKPEPKVFTKQHPCTKKHIWNCFKGMAGWRKVQIDIAHSEIGLNVPRVMERQHYLVKERLPTGDYYVMTPLGKEWLENGTKSFIRNHPAEAKNVNFPPRLGKASSVKKTLIVGNRVVRTR